MFKHNLSLSYLLRNIICIFYFKRDLILIYNFFIYERKYVKKLISYAKTYFEGFFKVCSFILIINNVYFTVNMMVIINH